MLCVVRVDAAVSSVQLLSPVRRSAVLALWRVMGCRGNAAQVRRPPASGGVGPLCTPSEVRPTRDRGSPRQRWQPRARPASPALLPEASGSQVERSMGRSPYPSYTNTPPTRNIQAATTYTTAQATKPPSLHFLTAFAFLLPFLLPALLLQ